MPEAGGVLASQQAAPQLQASVDQGIAGGGRADLQGWPDRPETGVGEAGGKRRRRDLRHLNSLDGQIFLIRLRPDSLDGSLRAETNDLWNRSLARGSISKGTFVPLQGQAEKPGELGVEHKDVSRATDVGFGDAEGHGLGLARP